MMPDPAAEPAPPYRPGAITTEALCGLAEDATEAAMSGNAVEMAFFLGRVAQWARTAAFAAEAATEA